MSIPYCISSVHQGLTLTYPASDGITNRATLCNQCTDSCVTFADQIGPCRPEFNQLSLGCNTRLVPTSPSFPTCWMDSVLSLASNWAMSTELRELTFVRGALRWCVRHWERPLWRGRFSISWDGIMDVHLTSLIVNEGISMPRSNSIMYLNQELFLSHGHSHTAALNRHVLADNNVVFYTGWRKVLT